jgi:hypothetical protein
MNDNIVNGRMNNDPYGDSDFLAHRDLTIGDFRESEKDAKHKIIENMLRLRTNKEYNKHLLSVYIKAKGIFDRMVEEHRAQLHYLEEIYRHINTIIREHLSSGSYRKQSKLVGELMKDKKQIGRLLKKMHKSYEKLTNIDTTISITIDKVKEITFIDENQENNDDDDDTTSDDEKYDDERIDSEDEDEDEDEDDDEGEDEDEDDDEGEDEDDNDADTDTDTDTDEDEDEDDNDADTDEDEDDADEDEDDEDEDEDDEDTDEHDADTDTDEHDNEHEHEDDESGIITLY